MLTGKTTCTRVTRWRQECPRHHRERGGGGVYSAQPRTILEAPWGPQEPGSKPSMGAKDSNVVHTELTIFQGFWWRLAF